jgi:hypothetical protein
MRLTQNIPVSEVAALSGDYVCIRGVRVELDELLDTRLLEQSAIELLRERFRNAQPFEHLLIDNLFNPKLLELIHADFDLLNESEWKLSIDGELEKTHRSLPGSRLGPASELYFALINSGWFLKVLSTISSIENLIADTSLEGGGLHETRIGGTFAIHTDFNKHIHTMLDNEMVLITYLNKDWDPAYGGALELWSTETKRPVHEIQPVFGRSVLLRHSARSFHGHPSPLTAPQGRTRRSVAAYYYTNRNPSDFTAKRHSTSFLDPGWRRLVKTAAKQVTPPIIWDALKSLRRP